MKIIIATNTNGVDRAFATSSTRSAQKIAKELIMGGWQNVTIKDDDCLMHKTLKIKIR